jgi:hypothetical protein
LQLVAVFVVIKAVALGAIVALAEAPRLPPLPDLLGLVALAVVQLGLLAAGEAVVERFFRRPA